MLKKNSFRKLLFVLMIIIFTSALLSVFFIFNNLYMNSLKKKYEDDAKVSSQTIINLLEENKEIIRRNTGLLGVEETIFNALVNKVDLFKSNVSKDELNIVKITLPGFIRIVNKFISNLYGSGSSTRIGDLVVALYSSELKTIVKSSNINNYYIEKGEEEYFLNFREHCLNGMQSFPDLYASEASIVCVNKDFYIKGITLINHNVFKREKRIKKEIDRYEFGVMTFKIDSEYILKLKRYTNKEIMLYSLQDNMIVNSTIYGKDNKPVQFENIKIRENELYQEFNIENKLYGFSFQPINGFEGKTIGYIGVGSDLSVIENIQRRATVQFTVLTFLFLIIILVILYITLKVLFHSFNKLLIGIDKVREDYNYKIKTDSYVEFKKIADAVNGLSKSVQDRENSLLETNIKLNDANTQLNALNQNLETIIEERTEELNKTQEKLIKTEKIATLGVIAGGIAHTINSPLTGVITTAELMKMDIDIIDDKEIRENLSESIEMIKEGAKKSAASIKELINYVEKHKNELNISTDADYELYVKEKNAMQELVDYTLRYKNDDERNSEK